MDWLVTRDSWGISFSLFMLIVIVLLVAYGLSGERDGDDTDK